jgi:hypothetical protein
MTKIFDSIWQRTFGQVTINLTRILALAAVLALFLSPQTVYAADNLANLNGTATASPNNTTASQSIDGDANTYWGSGSTQQESWLMVDLGAIYYIDGLEIDFTAQSSSPYAATVGISLDGQHFNSWDESTNPPQTWFSLDGFNPETSPQTDTFIARYVKLVFSANGSDQDVQIAEFKVYGRASVATVPVITTGEVTDISTGTATGNGSITTLGSLTLSDYGICWNTSGDPKCDVDNVISAGIPASSGPFTVALSNLTQGATYYVNAYITDGFSYFYGGEVQFTTNCATTTSLSPSVNPSESGQSVTFTATVAASVQAAGTPTGTVTFFEGLTTLDTVALTAGVATYTSAALSVATHDITAVYNGDSSFLTSTSNAVSQVVNQSSNNTTTLLVSSVNPSVFGQSVTFTATVAATVPGPETLTGTVTFSDGQTTLDTLDLTAGVATYTSAALSVATHDITAVYSGDDDFLTSTSSTLSQVVNQSGTTTAVVSSANPATPGQSITFTATVTPSGQGAGTPTGLITFSDGQTYLSTESMSGGTATYATSQLASGSHTIYASYNGDGIFVSSIGNLTQNISAANSQGGGGAIYSSPTYPTSITFSVSAAETVEDDTPNTEPASVITEDSASKATGKIDVTILDNQSKSINGAGNINVKITPGTTAVDDNGKSVTDITVKSVDAASLPITKSMPKNTILLAYEFGPDGTTFSDLITVTCTYNTAALPPWTNPAKILVAVYSPVTGKFTTMSCTVDTINHTVTFSTDHFSYYLLMVPDEVKSIVAQPETSTIVEDTANSPTTTPDATSPVTPENTVTTIIGSDAATSATPGATSSVTLENTGSTDAATSAPQPPTPPFNAILIVIIVVFVLIVLFVLLFVKRKNDNAKGS